ncbi:PSP1 domain-containing protein [Anaerofustis stercorihominis]|uniref:PSP1 domain-containing protein n=1 Tax=Anaerofustis stercorihominis TaxID=214853 RepID=UPI00214B52BF|nr:stage 0 sporulation family protein [Anaerofustis stercorihominis]MCR2032219.1 stage 0 sporulation family protein [Anaerofustis stercorihominis]
MQKVVGVRFKPAGKIYYFDPTNIYLKLEDNVIVETARGLEYGTVASKVKYVEEDEVTKPIKPVIRKATVKDTKTNEENLKKAEKALKICKEEIIKQKLDMKLIRAEYTFNASKVIFYFTADGRIDFRELVKNLASIFKIRIELRQIGVRDEAKILGGVGPCGCGLCCNKWLGEFEPVSIKMAKEQGLSLNPSKISGICGRLLCCLQYEHNCYEDALSRLPKVSDKVKTPDGIGTVERLNVLKETFLVKFENDGDIAFKEFTNGEVKVLKKKKKRCSNKDTCQNKSCPNHDKHAEHADENIDEELKKLEKDN